jgi:hypothetical protein
VLLLSISSTNTEVFAILLLDLSAFRARGPSHRARPGLEILETRELLSRAQTSVSGALSAAGGEGTVASRAAVPAQQSLDHNPMIETNVGGSVNRAPRFYELYRGPKRPDLHVLNTHAQFLFPQGFAFSGATVGKINSSQSSFYVFGVNRGGATAPGPFPNRPMIVFDAEVIVATSSDGFTGTVELLNSQGQTTSSSSLFNNQITFSNNHVRVVVPASLLPSTSPPGTTQPQNQYSYAFWAGTSPSGPKRIAGFVPQFADTGIPVKVLPTS